MNWRWITIRTRVSRSGDTDIDRLGATQWSVSYTYALSKRTLTYAGIVQTRNDSNAIYNFNINPYTVTAGSNASGLVVGMVHFF